MQSLRIVPNLRSSVVEEMPPGQVLLFTSRLGDADAALVGGPAVLPFTWPRLVRALRDPDLELVEVAEPLWLAEWFRAVRYVLLLRVVRPSLPGRRRVAVATYAIENLDARVRLRPRSLEGRPRSGAVAARAVGIVVGISVLLLDVVVFGTTGASENYRRAFGWALRRPRHTVLPARLGACEVCGPVSARGPREPTVLFLGAPSERKGFSVLTAAWETAGAAERGWRLVVADPDGGAAPPLPAGVSIRTRMPRAEVHRLLRTSAVVAMPSVRLRRWREQIGLPLVEGLAHGARVLTTTETGLAGDLADHPLVTFTVPGDGRSLADGLCRLMDAGPPDADAPIQEGCSKADVVRWWLCAATRSPRDESRRTSFSRL